MDWALLGDAISEVIAEPFVIIKNNAVGGGCINAAYSIESKNNRYFVKLNAKNKHCMFEAEAAGLAELSKADAMRVPNVICTGVIGSESYIVLENLNLSTHGSMQEFASQLVKQHRVTQKQFGWQQDNTIGSTTQLNALNDHWPTFWREQRLGFQLELAKQNGASHHLLNNGERLQAEFEQFFESYQPVASLLHGDLWSGNYAFTETGEPVIFDPATYYGDREADIAMTELFGGFSADFYRIYAENYPLNDGYALRKTLYNHYHILNHYNMFGGGYESQSNGMCEKLLAEIKG